MYGDQDRKQLYCRWYLNGVMITPEDSTFAIECALMVGGGYSFRLSLQDRARS